MRLISGAGQRYDLDEMIGEGGEGQVFTVAGHPELLAKLYHLPIPPSRLEKVRAIVQARTALLANIAAWPTDVLYEAGTRAFAGFLMPRVEDGKEIHLLYGPKTRIQEFPTADWRFLVRTAGNVARALAAVHHHGLVVGDINHASVFVAQNATVTLIDCDSFQVRSGGRLHLCEVGVPTHTPPELQGVDFNATPRTANHDNFGLAVTLFQLLFMGRHPFAGHYLGPGESPMIEELITRGCFVYSATASSQHLKQPPKTPPLSCSGPAAAALFERAFALSGATAGRPTALAWIHELDRLQEVLIACPADTAHQYHRALTACPWCTIEQQINFRLFPALFDLADGTRDGFNLEHCWEAIRRVTCPEPHPPSFSTRQFSVTPDSAAPRIKHKVLGLIAGFILVLATFTLLTFWLQTFALICFGAILLFPLAVAAVKAYTEEKGKYQEAVEQAQARYTEGLRQWKDGCGISDFQACFHELETARDHYQQLQQYHQRQLEELARTARARQLRRFLAKHRVEKGLVSKLGQRHCATLRGWGINTAADINPAALQGVPGLGNILQKELLNWRRNLEQRFIYNPNEAISTADRRQAEHQVEKKRRELEQALASGEARLKRLAHRVPETSAHYIVQLENLARAVAQAEANLAATKFISK